MTKIVIEASEEQGRRLLSMLRSATEAAHGSTVVLNNEIFEMVEASYNRALAEERKNLPYTSRGYKDQDSYYRNLAYIYDLDLSEIYRVSADLGSNADFTELPEVLASIAHDYRDETGNDDDI